VDPGIGEAGDVDEIHQDSNAAVCSDRKEEKNMRRMLGFLIGITVGGLVGSTIALLMAPESGEQLRTELRSRGEGFFSEVRHAADERKIELRQRLESMREPRPEG